MEINCGISQCLLYVAITVITLIVIIIIADILLYLAYSYFYVRRYYSSDIKQWRDSQYAKLGYFTGYNGGIYGGQATDKISSDWSELLVPAEKMYDITGNKSTLWSIDKDGTMYTCQKPCDGSADNLFWTKAKDQGQFRHISAADNITWTTNVKNEVFRNSKPVNAPKLKSVEMGKHDTWGIDTEGVPHIFKSDKWSPKKVKDPVVNIAVGATYIWALTSVGTLYVTIADGSNDSWIQLNSPPGTGTVKLLSVNPLTDKPYIVTNEGGLYTCKDCVTDRPVWLPVNGAPKFVSLNVNTEIYGIDKNGAIWKATA